jgi:polyisoprenoid-binding protein YceI
MYGRSIPILFALVLLQAFARPVAAEHWEVVGDGASEIVFISKAPLETFKGRTHQVSGWVDFDPNDLTGPLSFEIAVDLASFDTGKDKRNRHMRENHLETDRYPRAWFRGGTVRGATKVELAAGDEARVTMAGTLDLHGVQRVVLCEATLRRTGDGVELESGFEVKLSDHAIDRPKFLVMKLADEQQVEVRLHLRPGGSP